MALFHSLPPWARATKVYHLLQRISGFPPNDSGETHKVIIGMWLIFLLALPASVTHAANVCGESEVLGPYGAQTSGITKIAAGIPKPAVSLSRLVFNADKTVSGY